MESLDMNTLANSLPSSTLANAEADLLNNFKAAALSITTLYRSSRETSKKAYNAGYAQAYRDLLVVIQQGVSAGGTSERDGTSGMTIGRVMDYVEARLEAIKSREEEEDEEEEEKDKGRTKPIPSGSADVEKEVAHKSTPQFATHNNPAMNPVATAHSSPESSPPPPTIPTPRPLRKRSRIFKEAQATQFVFPDLPTLSSCVVDETPIGSKRRHASISMHDPALPSTPTSNLQTPEAGSGSATGSARRRTKNSRLALHGPRTNQADAMDVEEDGRERKRVARR